MNWNIYALSTNDTFYLKISPSGSKLADVKAEVVWINHLDKKKSKKLKSTWSDNSLQSSLCQRKDEPLLRSEAGFNIGNELHLWIHIIDWEYEKNLGEFLSSISYQEKQ
eukprot:TRINITY_DN1808_c0_g1_i1.p1 TRINITY_DN1808_c0_g1~~TRINITY_DN1808_c0_g1_i1.p1  ORF type:complete len:109 (+),score=10.15 TRINITY_DN1808_c0_g1_i1:137-463(+)